MQKMDWSQPGIQTLHSKRGEGHAYGLQGAVAVSELQGDSKPPERHSAAALSEDSLHMSPHGGIVAQDSLGMSPHGGIVVQAGEPAQASTFEEPAQMGLIVCPCLALSEPLHYTAVGCKAPHGRDKAPSFSLNHPPCQH